MFMKRVFLAIHIKDTVIIYQVINILKSELMAENISWAEPQNLHLTLRFFGPTEDLLLKKIEKQLEVSLQNQKPFSISFNKLGIFGSKYQPRVLWMGMDHIEGMVKLSETINTSIEEIGIHTDRQNFIPHIVEKLVNTYTAIHPWNLAELSEEIAEISGIQISTQELEKFRKPEDLKDYLSLKIQEQFEDKISKLTQ